MNFVAQRCIEFISRDIGFRIYLGIESIKRYTQLVDGVRFTI